jgi:hypothetical protein
VALLLGALAACSEKADEPSQPAAAPAGADQSAASGSAPLVVGIPEAAHLAASDIDVEAMVAGVTGGACRIEHVVTVTDERPATTDSPVRYEVNTKEGFRLVGFAVDKDAGTVPAQVDLVLSGLGTYAVPIDTGLPRGDVAEYFDNPAFANSGFMVDVAFSRVEPGDYAVYLVDKAGGTCSPSQSISVVE